MSNITTREHGGVVVAGGYELKDRAQKASLEAALSVVVPSDDGGEVAVVRTEDALDRTADMIVVHEIKGDYLGAMYSAVNSLVVEELGISPEEASERTVTVVHTVLDFLRETGELESGNRPLSDRIDPKVQRKLDLLFRVAAISGASKTEDFDGVLQLVKNTTIARIEAEIEDDEREDYDEDELRPTGKTPIYYLDETDLFADARRLAASGELNADTGHLDTGEHDLDITKTQEDK